MEQRKTNVPSLQALDLFLKELKKQSSKSKASQYLDLQRIKVRDTKSSETGSSRVVYFQALLLHELEK